MLSAGEVFGGEGTMPAAPGDLGVTSIPELEAAGLPGPGGVPMEDVGEVARTPERLFDTA